jgi:hypothetical protein
MMFTPGTYARTRHGVTVQIVHVLPEPDSLGRQVIGLIKDPDGDEIETWTAEGRFINHNMPSGLDLITAEALQ